MAGNKTNVGSFNLHEENLTLCHRYQTYTLLTNTETEFVGIKLIRRCCQTKPNTSQSTTIIQTYEAQILNHSVRAALRFCL